MDDIISRQATMMEARPEYLNPQQRKLASYNQGWNDAVEEYYDGIKALPSAEPEGYIKIPETGIDDLSDGFHTFRQLYYQRMMLFSTIVKQNKERSWKSLRHEDGEFCFGGGWFIVGIDTPEGSYTYHYEDNFFSLFDCVELERAKHWDGHTEKDVTRLLSLPSAERKTGKWLLDKHKSQNHIENIYICSSCRNFEAWGKTELYNYCPNCGADMRGEGEENNVD